MLALFSAKLLPCALFGRTNLRPAAKCRCKRVLTRGRGTLLVSTGWRTMARSAPRGTNWNRHHRVTCLVDSPFVMPNRMKKRTAEKTQPETLKGWQQIASFLGEPASVVQRWASDGMPVRRQGRYVETTPDELNAWLGKESGKPVHVATENTDLTAELKRALSFVRREKEPSIGRGLAGRSKKARRK